MRLAPLSTAALALLCVACAPSIDPAMQQATNELLATVNTSRQLPPPDSFEPMPWAVGQWVLLKATDAKGQSSVTRVSVVGKEGDGFWIEQEYQDYYRSSVTKILYARMPRSGDEAVDAMLKMVSKNGSEAPQNYDFTGNDPAARFAKGLMKSVAQGMVVHTPVDPQTEDAVVPGGSFRGCAKLSVRASFGAVSKETTSWFHPAVPINGTVKTATEDGQWVVELLDFGMTGARSRLE